MNAHGHTLLEHAVAAAVFAVVGTTAAGGWKAAHGSSADLAHRARALTEMRLAVESLRNDTAAAVTLEVLPPDALHIVREPAAAALVGVGLDDTDPGILYAWDFDVLVRRDLALGSRSLVATGLTRFGTSVAGRDGVILLTSGLGTGERTVTLRWQQGAHGGQL